MNSIVILAVITGLTLVGDYCIKIASSHSEGMKAPIFLLGVLLYGLPAVGWFVLMKSHSLAAIGVFYSASTILLLAALGYFVFREPLGWREIVGLTLAIGSVVVMHQSS